MEQRDMRWDVYRNRDGTECIIARDLTLADAEALCDAHNAHAQEEGYHYPLPTGFEEHWEDLELFADAIG